MPQQPDYPATPMPGLVTCVGYQQHTAGHSDVPLTVDHTAPHSVWGRVWGIRCDCSNYYLMCLIICLVVHTVSVQPRRRVC